MPHIKTHISEYEANKTIPIKPMIKNIGLPDEVEPIRGITIVRIIKLFGALEIHSRINVN